MYYDVNSIVISCNSGLVEQYYVIVVSWSSFGFCGDVLLRLHASNSCHESHWFHNRIYDRVHNTMLFWTQFIMRCFSFDITRLFFFFFFVSYLLVSLLYVKHYYSSHSFKPKHRTLFCLCFK